MIKSFGVLTGIIDNKELQVTPNYVDIAVTPVSGALSHEGNEIQKRKVSDVEITGIELGGKCEDYKHLQDYITGLSIALVIVSALLIVFILCYYCRVSEFTPTAPPDQLNYATIQKRPSRELPTTSSRV